MPRVAPTCLAWVICGMCALCFQEVAEAELEMGMGACVAQRVAEVRATTPATECWRRVTHGCVRLGLLTSALQISLRCTALLGDVQLDVHLDERARPGIMSRTCAQGPSGACVCHSVVASQAEL